MSVEEVKQWLFLQRPNAAYGMSYSTKIIGSISSISDDPISKSILLGLQQLSILFHSWNKQTARDIEQRMEGKDYRSLSPEEKILFEFVASNKQEIMDKIDEKFEDLKDFLEPMKVKVNKILAELTDIRFKDKYEQILHQYTDMIKRRNNLQEWAYDFSSFKAEFRTLLGFFEKGKVKEYLTAVYEQRCRDSDQPLYDAYKFVLEVRGMFTLIQQTYYSHINEAVLKNLPQLDPVQAALDETEDGLNATTIITEAAEDVYSGLFLAAMNLPRELAEKIKLKYIPTWEDIPMTSEYFWKKTNHGFMLYDKVAGIFQTPFVGTTWMCYRRKGDDFVRVFDSEDNSDIIYQLQENKKIKDGIYRLKSESGTTQLGYLYFDRSYAMTGEYRRCYLNMTVSGDIKYLEQIKSSKTNHEWKVVTKFVYNKETFTWSKVEL